MRKAIVTEQEIEESRRQREDRRMPGNARLRATRAVEVFRASVQKAKLDARRKKLAKLRRERSGDKGQQ